MLRRIAITIALALGLLAVATSGGTKAYAATAVKVHPDTCFTPDVYADSALVVHLKNAENTSYDQCITDGTTTCSFKLEYGQFDGIAVAKDQIFSNCDDTTTYLTNFSQVSLCYTGDPYCSIDQPGAPGPFYYGTPWLQADTTPYTETLTSASFTFCMVETPGDGCYTVDETPPS
jgi:hypothetical protein